MLAKFCCVGLAAAALAIGLFVMTDSASACKGKSTGNSQSANQQGMRGRIVSINNGSITVAVHKHHAKGQAAARAGATPKQPTTQTFQIGRNAQIAFIGGKNTKPATIGDLKPGEEVLMQGTGFVVQKIAIMHHEHHKKPAA